MKIIKPPDNKNLKINDYLYVGGADVGKIVSINKVIKIKDGRVYNIEVKALGHRSDELHWLMNAEDILQSNLESEKLKAFDWGGKYFCKSIDQKEYE